MLVLVKTISTSIDNLSRRLVKYCRYGKADIQTSIEVGPYGVDSNPIKDMVAVYAPTAEQGKTVIIGYLNKNKVAAIGEYRNFSTDADGNMVFYTWLKNDGTMEIGGNSDNMVRYSKLKDAFNQLRDDHNELVTKWDAFVSAYLPGGPVNVGTPPTLAGSNVGQSTADISGAKIEELKTL